MRGLPPSGRILTLSCGRTSEFFLIFVPVMCVVSIVIPVFNVEALLPRCLDSVLGQTFRDWEARLADDASADGITQVVG